MLIDVADRKFSFFFCARSCRVVRGAGRKPTGEDLFSKVIFNGCATKQAN